MLYRTMKKTGLRLSILGMGCMRLPSREDNTIDEQAATQIVRYAIDHGINYLDTAYPYHYGQSEPFLGRALKDGYRDRIYLATKLPCLLIRTREDMDRYLNEQLERLSTERIDFYLVHGLRRERWEYLTGLGLARFLDRAIGDGRIRYAGFSFHDDKELFKKIVDAYDWTVCQIQYNYLDEHYQAGREGLVYAVAQGLGAIIMEPLRGGKITQDVPGAITKIWNGAQTKRTPAEWGLRWVWNHPEVSVVLSGMTTMAQVEENIRSAEQGYPNSLSAADLALIDRVKEAYEKGIKVDCTGCLYCQPCPSGVRIPECFNHYNAASMFDDPGYAKRKYQSSLTEPYRASQCIECGECEERCPRQIPIRDRLKDVVRLFEQ